jgi:predicted O-methyltransferase YrrM
MWKSVVRGAAYAVAPSWAHRFDQRRWNAQHGRDFRDRLTQANSLAEKVRLALRETRFTAVQRSTEILKLCERVRDLGAARLCEIGTREGGSLALFAQVASPAAHLLSVDIKYAEDLARGYPCFARPRQRLTLLEADSHHPQTLTKVRRWLGREQLDFLFIDGDHSLTGVRRDFEMYAPLVRRGGLIAFHDIVPDYFTRFGRRTPSDTGDVPRFWAELKSRGYSVEELVENPEQDGMGIGVVFWDGMVR